MEGSLQPPSAGQSTENQAAPRAHAQSGGRPPKGAPSSGFPRTWEVPGARQTEEALADLAGPQPTQPDFYFPAAFEGSGEELHSSRLGGARLPKAPRVTWLLRRPLGMRAGRLRPSRKENDTFPEEILGRSLLSAARNSIFTLATARAAWSCPLIRPLIASALPAAASLPGAPRAHSVRWSRASPGICPREALAS